jgi:exopolysaccharide biosynthesis polyprenyl glycosylphosphotransferase
VSSISANSFETVRGNGLLARAVLGSRAQLRNASRPANRSALGNSRLSFDPLHRKDTLEPPRISPPRVSGPALLRHFIADLPVVLLSFIVVHSVSFGLDAQTGWRPSTVLWHVTSSDLGLVVVYAALISLFRDGNLHSHGNHTHTDWCGADIPVGAPRLRTGISVPDKQSMQSAFQAVAMATLVLAAGIALSGGGTVTTAMLAGAALINAVGMYGQQLLLKRLSRPGKITAKRVLIVGANSTGRQIAEYLHSHPSASRAVAGFVESGWRREEGVLGTIEDLPRIARTEFIDELIVAIPNEPDRAHAAILAAWDQHLDIQVVPDLYGCSPGRATIEQMGGVAIVALHEARLPSFGLGCKRLLDVALATAGLVLASPVMLAIAVAIKIDSRGSVLYRAPRAGKKGRPFLFYKFRTMRPDADQLKATLLNRNERQGPIFKISNDPRVTRLGRFLRRHSLDELPQLWNVLTGDMSMVGPRPHPVDDFRRYKPEDLRRLDVTPGITGAWQVAARRDSSFDRNMILDVEYIENWSFGLDIRILLQTFSVVLRGTGV